MVRLTLSVSSQSYAVCRFLRFRGDDGTLTVDEHLLILATVSLIVDTSLVNLDQAEA